VRYANYVAGTLTLKMIPADTSAEKLIFSCCKFDALRGNYFQQ